MIRCCNLVPRLPSFFSLATEKAMLKKLGSLGTRLVMLNDDGSLLCHLIGWTADLLTEARRLQRELVECEGGREEEGKRCLARIQTCLLRFRECGNEKLEITSQLLDTVSILACSAEQSCSAN